MSLALTSALALGCPSTPGGDDDDDVAEGEGEPGEGEGEEGEGEGEGEGEVRWFRDVLPVAKQNCTVCHVVGGIGHFGMEDLDAVVEHEDLIVDYVELGLMPPWMPAKDCGPDGAPHTYHGDRSLTDEEKLVFTRWREGGFVYGDPSEENGDEPAVIGLPRVDLALEPAQVYIPTDAAGADDYHCFILDPAQATEKFVTGYDIVPGERAIVHHVLLFAVDRAAAQVHEDETPGFGWSCFGGPDVENGNGFPNTLGAWAPGTDATVFPAGTGIALSPDDVIVMQVHYNFAAIVGPAPADQSSVQLQLEDAVANEALLVPVPNDDFSLPPGVETTDTLVVPGLGRKIWGVMPHMHQLGQSISLKAASAGCIVDVPIWDFQWQQSYFFKDVDFVQLGGLEQVTLSCTWFNPTANTITWGEGTTDEMCLAYAYTTQ